MTSLRTSRRTVMRDLFAGMSIRTGHFDYERFIVLGRSRTGSNLLRSLLNAHSKVEAYGEIFRNPSRGAMDWDHIGNIQQSDQMHRLLINDPVKFIDTRVFRRYPMEIQAVGFKIFYYHAHEGNWQAIWPYLQQQTSTRVIHMKRQNLLNTHVSRKRAEITDIWVNTTGRAEQSVSVMLDYDECLADFQRTRAWEEEYDARLAGHPKIELLYEELAQNTDREMVRVQKFLGLDYQPVAPTIFKQSQHRLSRVIANYDELKIQFAGSPWADFFED